MDCSRHAMSIFNYTVYKGSSMTKKGKIHFQRRVADFVSEEETQKAKATQCGVL